MACGPEGKQEMRDFGIDKLPSTGVRLVERLGGAVTSGRAAGNNEAFQALWEIGVHLAAFLGIAFAADLLLMVLGISR